MPCIARIEGLEPRRLMSVAAAAQEAAENITAALAERLARRVYADGWAVGQPLTDEGNGAPLGYTIDRVWDDAATGFYALGLTSADNGPALVLRGSQFDPNRFDFKDLISDANPKGVGYDQFAANWQSVRGWLKALNAAVDMTGHSLGGALAQWFAAAWTADAEAGATPVDQVFTWQSPGIAANASRFRNLLTHVAAFKPEKAAGVSHYVTLGDIVSMGGEAYLPGNVVTGSFADLNLVNKHIKPLLNASLQGQALPAGLVITNPGAPGALTSAQLSAGAYVHNDADYRFHVLIFQMVANGLAIADPTLTPLTLVPPLMLRRDSMEASRRELGAMLNAVSKGWNIQKNGPLLTLTFQGQNQIGLLKGMRFVYDENLRIAATTANPKTLTFDGKMRFSLGGGVNIPAPAWLGGPINANALIELAELDANGAMDAASLRLGGSLRLFGSFGTINSTNTLDWKKGTLAVSGDATFLNGFITTNGATTIDSALNIAMNGDANVNIPQGAPVFAGRNLGTGKFALDYSDNGNNADDFIEGVGILRSRILDVPAGLRVNFDGSVTGIGVVRIPPLPFEAESDLATAFDVPPGQAWLILQSDRPSASAPAPVQLIDPDGVVYTSADFATSPDLATVDSLTDSRGTGVIVRAPKAGRWTIVNVGGAGLGPIEHSAYVPALAAGVEVLGAVGGVARAPVVIDAAVSDPGTGAVVAFYYDRDGVGGDGVRIASVALPPGAPGQTPISLTWDVGVQPAGLYHVYAVVTSPQGPAQIDYAAAPVRVTDGPPALASAAFAFDDFHAITLRFDQSVATSVQQDDFVLTNLSTGAVVPPGLLDLTYDPVGDRFALTAPGAVGAGGAIGILPDGAYRLTAPAASIANADGETLAAPIDFAFHVLAGDANRDRVVDAADLAVLASQWQQPGRVFSQGDFNYDGVVDVADLGILATNWQSGLPAAPAPTAFASGKPAEARSARLERPMQAILGRRRSVLGTRQGIRLLEA